MELIAQFQQSAGGFDVWQGSQASDTLLLIHCLERLIALLFCHLGVLSSFLLLRLRMSYAVQGVRGRTGEDLDGSDRVWTTIDR